MSTSILFITQMQETIDELNKIIDENETEHSFFYAADSSSALNIISENVIKAVVVDLRFSKFDASGFLALLQNNFSKIFRLSLASSQERQKAITLSNFFHRTIKIPLVQKDILKTLSELGKLYTDELDASWVEKINSLGPVPVLPDMYLRLEQEINSSNTSMHRIAEIIQKDPLMVARILHIAHSSFYNIPSGVTNLLQALNYLGMNIIKSLVLYIKIFSISNVSNETQALLKIIKTHSISVAKLAKAIMEDETKDKKMIELAYITGLLHDVGKIFLLQINDKQKKAGYEETVHSFNSHDIEDELFGISHVKVGTYILRVWGFQDEIIDAVASHHDSTILDGKTLTLKEALYIANGFSYEMDQMSEDISKSYGSEKFDQWDRLFNGDIRPSLDLPI